MSKDDFSAAEFSQRHTNVRKRMAERNIDLLLVIAPTNIQYLIGSRTKGYREFQCLLFPLPHDQPIVLLTRLAEVAESIDQSIADEVCGWGGREPEDPIKALERILLRDGRPPIRVGVELPKFYLSIGEFKKLSDLFAGNFVDATYLIEDIKVAKSPAELTYVRRAAEIIASTMEVAKQVIRVGATECEVAGEIYKSVVGLGGDLPPGPINLVSGERSCYSHGAPTERVLRPGDDVNIEFAAAYRRYCSTIGRQFSLGKPSLRVRNVFDAVREASDRCIDKIAPGARAEDAHLAVKKVLTKYGLDEFRTHITGYGVAPGYPPSWGESLSISTGSNYIFRPGMVLSIEPAVYIHKERLGLRIIDNVIVTDRGCQVLTAADRNIIVL